MIHPFAGFRLSPRVLSEEETLCLPYDCLTASMERVLRKGAHNAIHLEEPRPTSRAGIKVWASWSGNGTLKRDPISYYILVDSFGNRQRIGLLGLIDLKASKNIWAHEQCYRRFVEKRKTHFLRTKLHLSPVFLIAEDKEKRLKRALEKIKNKLSHVKNFCRHSESSFDGVQRSLYCISDRASVAVLEQALTPRDGFLIADGHHRYMAALELAKEGRLGSTLCYVTSSHLGAGLLKEHPPVRGRKKLNIPAVGLDEVIVKAKMGELFPRKTTYFWPKIPCGLVYGEIRES